MCLVSEAGAERLTPFLLTPRLSTAAQTVAKQYLDTDRVDSMCCCAAELSHSVVSGSLQPMDCSPPGSSVHGISQVRILE